MTETDKDMQAMRHEIESLKRLVNCLVNGDDVENCVSDSANCLECKHRKKIHVQNGYYYICGNPRSEYFRHIEDDGTEHPVRVGRNMICKRFLFND